MAQPQQQRNMADLFMHSKLNELYTEHIEPVGRDTGRTRRLRPPDAHWKQLHEQFAVLEDLRERSAYLKELSQWPGPAAKCRQPGVERPDDMQVEEQWDVTNVTREAFKALKRGEVLFGDDFDLSHAMNAVELMEPKMDSGMENKPRFKWTDEKLRLFQEQTFDDRAIVTFCDAQLALIGAWILNGECLDDTVHTNVLSLYPDACGENVVLNAIVNALNFMAYVFMNVVESAEIIQEDDSVNRKSNVTMNFAPMLEIITALDQAVDIQSEKCSFSKFDYMELSGRLKADRPNVHEPADAVMIRLLFLNEFLNATAAAFPMLLKTEDATHVVDTPDKVPKKKRNRQKRKPTKKQQRAGRPPAGVSDPNLERADPGQAAAHFKITAAFCLLCAESAHLGHAPPSGWDTSHYEQSRTAYTNTRAFSLHTLYANGFYDENPDGDYEWLPIIIPHLTFHITPNTFPRKIRHISRSRAHHLFLHFFAELSHSLAQLPQQIWTVEDILADLCAIQDRHYIIRAVVQLIVLTTKMLILNTWDLETLTENGIDCFSPNYQIKQLLHFASVVSKIFEEPIPLFDLDQPDWPELSMEQALALSLQRHPGQDEQSEMQRVFALQRCHLHTAFARLLAEISRVHSVQLQCTVHSRYHFRLRFCTQLAEMFAQLVAKAAKVEGALNRVMLAYNRHAISAHLERLRLGGPPAPLPAQFGGCPPLVQHYLGWQVFSLVKHHLHLTLHLDIVPMHELDMLFYIYFKVLMRIGTLMRLMVKCQHDTQPMPLSNDLSGRTPSETDRIRQHAAKLPHKALCVCAETLLAHALINVVRARKAAGLLPSPPNEPQRFRHRCKQAIPQSVRENFDLFKFNPTYDEYQAFLQNIPNLSTHQVCRTEKDFLGAAIWNFRRFQDFVSKSEYKAKFADELIIADHLLNMLSAGAFHYKNAFRFTFPAVEELLMFGVQIPGHQEAATPTLGPLPLPVDPQWTGPPIQLVPQEPIPNEEQKVAQEQQVNKILNQIEQKPAKKVEAEPKKQGKKKK